MRKRSASFVMSMLASLVAVLLLALYSVKRRRRPHLDVPSGEGGFDDFLPSLVGITQGTLVAGNSIDLIHNGKFFDELHNDLRAAKNSINFETFLCKAGEASHAIAEILCEKAKEGVEVRMLVDGSGGKEMSKDDLRAMKEAGVIVQRYHPIRFEYFGVLNNRDHRKIVIVDGRIGYIGGHCLVDNWLGDADDAQHFRDITARVEGPVVAQLQSAFGENWIEASGDVPAGEKFYPRLEPRGKSKAHVAWVSPTGSPSTVHLLHLLAIRGAQKRITIQNPYFLPDADARNALLDAVKRGVEVRVMIPDHKISDSPIVQHASHHRYGTLLAGGVKLFDYQRTLLHQKVMTVDGIWSAIGSTNFDPRSFELNDEATMGIFDEDLAAELEASFERDLEHAEERHLETWNKRDWGHKVVDFLAYALRDQL